MRNRRWVFHLALVAGVLALGGCSAVQLSPEYSDLLDKTAALSDQTAARAEAGALTPAQMTTALRGQAGVWQQFRDARDAKGAQ